jgi:N-acetylglucosaminyl-diphospho-decaprenol L-rhamnosyltransferase
MPAVDLSVVIVSWNVRDLLLGVLASLPAAIEPLAWEAIVVDNASSDGSAAAVAGNFPQVILLNNQANAGFAVANNQGTGLAHGRYVLFLNSDTVVPRGALARLVEFMEAQPAAGACSPRLLRPDGSLQPYAFGQDPAPAYLVRRGANQLLFHRHLHDWSVTTTEQVDWVSGACLLLRRTALDQVGLLDEHFFMYYEDNDLCLRLRQAGWAVYYYPDVEITHLGGQSLRQNPAAHRAYQDSLRYFYAKHYGQITRAALGIALAGYNLLQRATRNV